MPNTTAAVAIAQKIFVRGRLLKAELVGTDRLVVHLSTSHAYGPVRLDELQRLVEDLGADPESLTIWDVEKNVLEVAADLDEVTPALRPGRTMPPPIV